MSLDPKIILGGSFYTHVYTDDLGRIKDNFKELFARGRTRTPYYRLMGGNGRINWMQSEFWTVKQSTRAHRGQYVIGKHNVLGLVLDVALHTRHSQCPLGYS